MFDIKRKTIDWAGRPLTLETGRIARQADGAVLATSVAAVQVETVASDLRAAGKVHGPIAVEVGEPTSADGEGVRLTVARATLGEAPPKG